MMYTTRTLQLVLLSALALAQVQAFSPVTPSQRSGVPVVTTSTILTAAASSNDADVSRRQALKTFTATVAAVTLAAVSTPLAASARLEAVNRPDLLPNEKTNVIQVEKFLTSGQAKRMNEQLTNLERDTGFRVRVLCQAYPTTPGLAIRDYWDLGKETQKDDKYIVLVVDQFGGKGNVLNFNVGEGVKFALPNVFWTRLQAKFGTVRCVDCAVFSLFDLYTHRFMLSRSVLIYIYRRSMFVTMALTCPLSMRLTLSLPACDRRRSIASKFQTKRLV